MEFKYSNKILFGIVLLLMLIPIFCKAQNAPLPTINGFTCGDSYESVISVIKNRGYSYKTSSGVSNKIITIKDTNILLDHIMKTYNFYDTSFVFQSDGRLTRINVDLNNEGRSAIYYILNECTKNTIFEDENCFLSFTNEYWRAFVGFLGKETYAGPSNPGGSYTQRISWNYRNGKVVFSRSINWSSRRKYSIDIHMTIECDNLPPLESDPRQIVLQPKQPTTSQGSGVIISLENGLIATNYHVVENAQSLSAIINGLKVNARVVSFDDKNDLAIIAINPNNLNSFQPIPFVLNITPQEVGESVYTLGYPMSDALGEEIKLTDGIISSRTGYQGDVSTYQISAPIQPGSSGGALFDKKGSLIGITNAGVESAQNVGYAIKASYLKNLIDSSPYRVVLSNTNRLAGLSLSEQVKRVSPYIVMVLAESDNRIPLNNTVVLDLKEKMDWNSRTLSSIPVNSRAEILELLNKWAKIRFNGRVGFIASSWLSQPPIKNTIESSIQPSDSQSSTNSASSNQIQSNNKQSGETLKAKSQPQQSAVESNNKTSFKLKNNFEINVQQTASSNSKIIGKIPPRGTIEVLEDPNGSYVKIKINSTIGFISSKWITLNSLHE